MLPAHPICIKNQYENNNILGLDNSKLKFGGVQTRVDTSELRFGGVQQLVLELETRPRTEQFKSHANTTTVFREILSNSTNKLLFCTYSETIQTFVYNFEMHKFASVRNYFYWTIKTVKNLQPIKIYRRLISSVVTGRTRLHAFGSFNVKVLISLNW